MKPDFDSAVAETFVGLSLASAENFFTPVIAEVEKEKAAFGKLMRATAIGRDQAPVFGVATKWTALTDAWMRRKRTYPRAAFYKGLSPTEDSLAKDLFSMPGENLFGRTQLRTRVAQVQTAGFYNPRIRRQIDTVYRNDRGQFARADAKARVSVKVQVDPFPNLARDDMIGQLRISDKSKIKLYANDEKRPLVAPYTEWFFERKLRSKILSMMKRLR